MSFLQIVIYVVMNLPKFMDVIKEIITLIHSIPSQKPQIVDALSKAIEAHKTTGDIGQLERICTGLGCAPKLVTNP